MEAKDTQVGVLDLSSVAKFGYNFVKDYRILIDYPKKEVFFTEY